MHAHDPVPPRIDDLRDGRYLGSGGFGEVFLYTDVNTSARFAVKVLRDGALAMGGAQQIMHEAQALGRLSVNGLHPNIVAVQRVGMTGRRPFLVMEYCPGGSWAQEIGAKGRIHPSKVLSVGIQIAGALYMAHRQGIVHRDIKPGNILLAAHGIPKLGDFGIAALTADEVARGSAWMSRDYCAPEVLEAGEADELADIFSLAATLYHALAGRSWVREPGGDNSPEAMERRILAGEVPAISGSPPEALEWLLRAAMSRDRTVRAMTMPTAREFAEHLQDIELELDYAQTRLPIEEAGDTTSRRPAPPRVDAPRPSLDTTRLHWADHARDDARQPETVRREVPKPPRTLERRQRRIRPMVWVGTGVVALAVGGVLLANAIAAPTGPPHPSSSAVGGGEGALPEKKPVPVPVVVGVRDGDVVTFTWTYEGPEEGDRFVVRPDGATAFTIERPEWSRESAARVCVTVRVLRSDGRLTERGEEECA